MDGSAEEQLGLIWRVVAVMRAANISAWLFGGWGLDARLGQITRDHDDVEFWVDHGQSQRSKALLTEAGAIPLLTQPPEESCEFTWDSVSFSTAYFGRQPDGTITLKGRWSDWQLPAESFGDDPGVLSGLAVPTMSAAGMLAMKEQFPSLRNGRPWREKDREDIEVLRALVQTAGQH
jgi:lincosamide nucleotidyltransferase A/C/D/E